MVTAAAAAVVAAVAIAVGIEGNVWGSGEALTTAVCESEVTEAMEAVVRGVETAGSKKAAVELGRMANVNAERIGSEAVTGGEERRRESAWGE